MPSARPKIVVLGIMSRHPVAGVVWQTAHYLVGFERLGFDAYYVEAHGMTPSKLMQTEHDDSSALAAGFIAETVARFGLAGRWAFHALHADGRVHGMTDAGLRELYRSAAVVVNLSGATEPRPEHAAGGRRVFLETDPVQLQIELHDGAPEAFAFLRPHAAFFTFGENYGRPGCRLPVCPEFDFRPTRQPVVCDFWPGPGRGAEGRYTTVGNWNQDLLNRDVVYRGERYTWSTHHEFLKVLDLPRRTGAGFELALSSGRLGDADRQLLREHGWRVRDTAELSDDLDLYRNYVRSSRGEFTVAKDQNVRLWSGWFSDRSACYLAAGRPVVTQETGFRDVLPTGEGLFGFSTVEEAADAVGRIEADYDRHSRAALRVARECFDSDVVLGKLLTDLGLRAGEGRTFPAGGPDTRPFPASLVLTPVSRWPTRLPEETERAVLDTPLPPGPAAPPGDPDVSVVVVTFNNLAFTRLCLETLLAQTDGPAFEVVVVDNGSSDGTREYLAALARAFPNVRPVLNADNRGFAAANNQGLAAARGRVLVLLNNDTIPPRGWLAGLVRHLADPAVGLVGPVTNRCGNEAQVEAAYRTLGELEAFAADHVRSHRGESFDIRLAAMFCVAMRRDVFERVGPLDERFGVGLFEDDDYGMRVRATGLRVVCAEDVFVHHFGQASIGKLAADGEYGRLFHANRRRWEEKWGRPWEPYRRRRPDGYRRLVERVREAVEEAVPAGATVAVVSRGDPRLLDLGDRPAVHFPQADDGTYAGEHPADDADAIARLEAVRARGADYLLVPGYDLWLLDDYPEFGRHVRENYRAVEPPPEGCAIFALRPPGGTATPSGRRLTPGEPMFTNPRPDGTPPDGRTTDMPDATVGKNGTPAAHDPSPLKAASRVGRTGSPRPGRTTCCRPRSGSWNGCCPKPPRHRGRSATRSSRRPGGWRTCSSSAGSGGTWSPPCRHDRVADRDSCVVFRLSPTGPRVGPPTAGDRARAADPDGGPRADRKAARRSRPGGRAGRPGRYDPRPLFDAEWYLEQYPDVRRSGVDPVEHYRRVGAKEGRSPRPLFDAKYYWRQHPESLLECVDPLRHYLKFGWKRGCRPNPGFDPRFYLATYPDVAASGMEPLTHYVLTGLREGRTGDPEDLRVAPFEATYRIPTEPMPPTPTAAPRAKAIAFYLPQFHPIPENDAWWGTGFTEWTNVRRAGPQFDGHYQPHVPAGLGYYDLRDETVPDAQAELARRHGIHGFCFYFYWFDKTILLDLPVRRILATGKPDFPFCICWANDNWTRRWGGLEKEVLIAQRHSAEDDLAFIRHVEPILTHKNYIRVDGKPLLLVYRPGILPDAGATASRWRDYFQSRGHGGLYLAATRTFNHTDPPADYGFDAVVQFPPHLTTTPVTHLIQGLNPAFEGRIHNYDQAKWEYLEQLVQADPAVKMYPGVMPSWDNTARRMTRSSVWVNTSPESYHDWLSKACEFVESNHDPDHRMVFVNAWNEWAEGCHLEPDDRHGHAWLNATRMALVPTAADPPATKQAADIAPLGPVSANRAGGPLDVLFVSHDAHPHGAQHSVLHLAAWLKQSGQVNPRFLLAGRGPLADEFARVGPVLYPPGLDDRAEYAADGRAVRLLRSFCGDTLSAAYLNSAASGHVANLTRHLGVPHVAHVHEPQRSIERWVGPERMRALRDHARLVIAASPPVADNLVAAHRIPRADCRVVEEFIRCTGIPPATPPEKRRLRRAVGFGPECRTVLGCGTTDWRKGPDLFLEVAERAVARLGVGVEFVWVGGETAAGELAALRKAARAKGLADRVRFPGSVGYTVPYMLAADRFLLPSREDPFPLVCLEAADCGLPTVCFADAGGMPGFVGRDCGAVVPFEDAVAVADRAAELLQDPAALRAAGEAARKKVRDEYDVSVKGRVILELLKDVCGRRPTA